MNRAVVLLLAVLPGLVFVLPACNEPAQPPKAARAVTKVYDLSITLDLKDASGAEEYYTVERDGMLGFGGGLDARFNRISYSVPLEPADMQRLQTIIQDDGLMDRPLESTNQPKTARYSVKIRDGEKYLSKSLKGEIPRLEPLRAALKEFANRRLGEILDRQPKPSIQQPSSATTVPATQP